MDSQRRNITDWTHRPGGEDLLESVSPRVSLLCRASQLVTAMWMRVRIAIVGEGETSESFFQCRDHHLLSGVQGTGQVVLHTAILTTSCSLSPSLPLPLSFPPSFPLPFPLPSLTFPPSYSLPLSLPSSYFCCPSSCPPSLSLLPSLTLPPPLPPSSSPPSLLSSSLPSPFPLPIPSPPPPVLLAVVVLIVGIRWYTHRREQELQAVYMMVDRIMGKPL